MIELTQEEIIKDWKNTDIVVSINTLTYNHEKYIAQCIEGILLQKTNFAFELLIHDDASTDRTAEIIREYEEKYPLIIKPIYQTENQWAKGIKNSVTYQYPRAKGKYIAICEGDDYWVDENKLQIQVDFLENNSDYGMCYTKTKQYVQNIQKFRKKDFGSYFNGFEDLLINGNKIPTLTAVYKKELLQKYQLEIQPANKGWLMGDYPMWLYFSHESKIKFFDKVTAVYRVLENSASHSVDVEKQFRFEKNTEEIKEFYSKLYEVHYDSLADEIIYFRIYVNILTKKFNIDVAKEMRSCFRCMEKRNLKTYIFFLSSYSIITWQVLKKIRGV